MTKAILTALAMGLWALPAQAGWELRQSDGFATTSYDGGRYRLVISCQRGRGFELNLLDTTQSGDQMAGVPGLMLWLTLPDGRTDRWPVDVMQEGPALSGALHVSAFNLEFFRNGQRFQLDAPLSGQVFVQGDMTGTGAARLAFLEHCDT